MTDQDRAKLRDMQAEIDALSRMVAAGDPTAQAAMRQKQREQIEFCRALGFQIVGDAT
jgi:Skp family chaperone for outer membrane proteins